MASNFDSRRLHFLLLPLMAPGHMIPMFDMAKLLATKGVTITVATTPLNAARFKPILDRATQSGLGLRLALIHFPPEQETGLPGGCENVDMLPTLGLARKFIMAAGKFQEQLENMIDELDPRPSCLISDISFPWTTDVARMYNIPRIVFHGMCCFSLFCSHIVMAENLLDTIESELEPFVVPGLPERIELTKAKLPSLYPRSLELDEIRAKIRESEKGAFGVLVNSFEELEVEYFKRYREAKGFGVWCVGPVSLCNRDSSEKIERGNKASIDGDQLMKWLDSHKHGSVIFACLGSLCPLIPLQTVELALGLEASNYPFIWVIRGGYKDNLEEVEKWIQEDGYEERIKGRGLVIRGWAPQVLILSHLAVGGLLTHCGWNSTIECISSGLPMVTWPMFAEQFCNEKLVVQVLRIGLSIGVDVSIKMGEEDKMGLMVNKEQVKRAVEMLMDEGEEGEERRRRARELGEMAKRAVEDGGSSKVNMESFIQEIIQQNQTLGIQ